MMSNVIVAFRLIVGLFPILQFFSIVLNWWVTRFRLPPIIQVHSTIMFTNSIGNWARDNTSARLWSDGTYLQKSFPWWSVAVWVSLFITNVFNLRWQIYPMNGNTKIKSKTILLNFWSVSCWQSHINLLTISQRTILASMKPFLMELFVIWRTQALPCNGLHDPSSVSIYTC